MGFEARTRFGRRAFVHGAGMIAVQALLERQRRDLCGAPHRPTPGRRADRGGHARGRWVLGGGASR
jgi:hypothetical protein